MGVKNLKKTLDSHAPDCLKQCSLDDFSGYRIAIDLDLQLYRIITTKPIKMMFSQVDFYQDLEIVPDLNIAEQETRIEILRLAAKFMTLGITPVFVTDGKPHPLKRNGNPKSKHDSERKKQKQEDFLDEFYECPGHLRTRKLIDQFKKNYLANFKIRFEFKETVCEILLGLGIPLIKADEIEVETNDAEAICALLGIYEFTAAGYTRDTDFHVYGGELQIVEINGNTCQYRSLNEILIKMDLDFESFQDLCILHGTDFNTNPNRIGPVKAYQIIKNYQSIEQWPDYQKYPELSKYPEIKAHFDSTYQTEIDFSELEERLDLNWETFHKTGKKVLAKYNLEYIRTWFKSLEVEIK